MGVLDGIRAQAAPHRNATPLGPLEAGIPLRVLAILVVTVAATLAFAAEWDSPVRVALVLAFLLFAPGLALAEALEIREPLQRLALATAASLSVEIIVAIAVLYAGLFSARLIFSIVVAVTVGASIVAVARAPRAPPSATDTELGRPGA